MRRPQLVVLIGALALVLAGCTGGDGDDEQSVAPTPSVVDGRTVVAWESYSDDLQSRIDYAEDNGDCEQLTSDRISAESNGETIVDDMNHDPGDLLAYIDEAIELAGC